MITVNSETMKYNLLFYDKLAIPFSKPYLSGHLSKNKMNFNFLPLSIISITLLVLIPNSVAFGQMNPWGLFQQLCQAGRFATGPQCQNLQTQQQSSAATSSSSASSACLNGFTTLCAPGTNTGSTTTSSGTCPTGFTIQSNFCVPSTSTTTTSTTCPINSVLQNGVCAPTTTQTPLP